MPDPEKPRTQLGPALAILAALCVQFAILARARTLYSVDRLPSTIVLLGLLHAGAVGAAAAMPVIGRAPRPRFLNLISAGVYLAIALQVAFAGVLLERDSRRMFWIAVGIFWTTAAVVLFGPLRIRLLTAVALATGLTVVTALPTLLRVDAVAERLGL